jgi:hypothetical protein
MPHPLGIFENRGQGGVWGAESTSNSRRGLDAPADRWRCAVSISGRGRCDALILRILLDAIATSQRDRAKLQAEVLVLRRQVQVLERQIKRVGGPRPTAWCWPPSVIACRDLPGQDCGYSPRPSWDGIATSSGEDGRPIEIAPVLVDPRIRRNVESSSSGWPGRTPVGATSEFEASC